MTSQTPSRFWHVFALCGVLLFVTLGIAQTQGAPVPQPTAPNGYVDDRTWMTETWTEDDTPFIEVEKGIARLQKRGVKLRDRLPAYRAAALADMTNRPNLYRWAYVTAQVVKPINLAIGAPTELRLWSGMFETLMRPTAPDRYMYEDENYKKLFYAKKLPLPIRSYRYSRMLFIAAVMGSRNAPLGLYRELGDRLLQRNPRDFQVKAVCSQMAGTYVLSRTEPLKEEPKKMLRYAQELVRDNPKDPSYLLVLSWAQMHNRNLAGAKASSQRYLKLAPANASYRRNALYQLQTIARRNAKK